MPARRASWGATQLDSNSVARCAGDASGAGSTPNEVLPHAQGSVSLAATQDGGKFSYGSAFFVVLGEDGSAHDGKGLVIGKCVHGFELFAQMAGGGATVTDAGELSQSTWNFMNPDAQSDDEDDCFSD